MLISSELTLIYYNSGVQRNNKSRHRGVIVATL